MNYSGTPDLREPLAGRTSRCSLGLAPEPDAQGPVGLVSRVGGRGVGRLHSWALYVSRARLPELSNAWALRATLRGSHPHLQLRGAVGWEGPACTSVHPARLKAGCASWRREGRSPDPGGGSGCWQRAGPRACRSQATVGRAPWVGARGREGPGPWGGCDWGARNPGQHPARSPHHLWPRASVFEGRARVSSAPSPTQPSPPSSSNFSGAVFGNGWRLCFQALPSSSTSAPSAPLTVARRGEAGRGKAAGPGPESGSEPPPRGCCPGN